MLKSWVGERKYWGLQTETQKEVHWKAVERARSGWYSTATQTVKKRFEDEKEQVLYEIRTAAIPEFTQSAIDDILFRGQQEWENVLLALYLTVGEDFANRTFGSLTKQVQDVWKDEVLSWLSHESSQKVTQITETTRDQIRKKLKEGVDEGIGIDKLAERIDELYLEQIIPYRSEVISRTEVISASNLGSRAGALATGLDLKKEWIATRDTRTREDHADADGQVTEMDQPYIAGGEKLLFPGDTSFGASASNVIQCRCTEGYYRKGAIGTPRATRTPQILQQYPSLRQAIRAEEEDIWNRSRERAVIITQNGEIIFRKDGTKKAISFTHDEMLQMFGHQLTHNHPPQAAGSSGGSFSGTDIVMMRKSHLKEIRAVDNYARYSIKPPRGGWEGITETEIKNTYWRYYNRLLPAYQNDYSRGIITFTEFINEHSHAVVEATANELGFRYRRTPWLGEGRLRKKGWIMADIITRKQESKEDVAFILDADRDTPGSPVCSFCRHLKDHRYCAAFPARIPDEIWFGENKHTKPYPGDNGIQFEKRK